MPETGNLLRPIMRQWTSGVAVVTCRAGEEKHGLTANSLVSISMEPPLVAVTLSHQSQTYSLVEKAQVFAVTILAEDQENLADRFAGRTAGITDRFEGLQWFTLQSGSPLLVGGLAFLDCNVVNRYVMSESTLFVGQVIASDMGEERAPLLYHNRRYRALGK